MIGPAHHEYLATRYFTSLDGLRCLAILPVMWHHATPRPLPGLLGKGPAGVDLFFCISGFLITTLLLREKKESEDIGLLAFYARRALRILPLYFAMLLGYVALALCLPESAPQRAHFFRTVPYYATFTANWFADSGVAYPVLFSFAWSLCVEEQFYAFWPWLVRRLPRSGAGLVMLALLVIDVAAERGLLANALSPQALRILTSFATPIGLGALLALALDERRVFDALRYVLGAPWSAPAALLAVIALLVRRSAPLLVFQLVLTALVGACVMREEGSGLRALLEARPVRYVGRVSYGLYLLNMTAIGLVRRAFPVHAASASFVFWLSLPLALAFAALSHRYFEAPLLRLGSRFRKRSVQRSSTKSA